MVFLALGMIEIARGLMVKQTLSDAARRACRNAILSTGSNANITTDVNAVLTDNNITSSYATITVQVNGSTADANTAAAGDKISVKVSIPVSRIAWITPIFLPSTDIESDTMVMMRQQ
jgi:hypothetical protein